MGMLDYYQPRPDLSCPVCDASNLEWQGKDGPCALFLWEQGHAAPINQLIEENLASRQKSERSIASRPNSRSTQNADVPQQ